MQSKRQGLKAFAMAGLVAVATVGWANNICVTNVSVTDSGTTYTYIQCDVSWDNSWKASWTEGSTTLTNWDAAWVFVKFRVATNNAPWRHASLSASAADHVVPAGAALDVGLTGSKGAGVFLYRSAAGDGTWTNTVKLRWNYTQDGVTIADKADKLDVSVHAIEMVYVPKGNFYAGDGGTALGQFEAGISGTPFLVTNDNYSIALGGGGAGSLGNNNTNGMYTGSNPADDFNDIATQTLPAAFPKGYNPFYCMKHELSQGQYANFLNQLSSTQAGAHYVASNYNKNRYSITNMTGVYVATAPDWACNWLLWADNAAYTDWAGLRPMSELEFEKACRGPLTPVVNEHAWGSLASAVDIASVSGVDGSGSETAVPSNANINFNNNNFFGPVRCGIFATASSGRVSSGATYWGILDVSGNVWERAVSVGNTQGRAFTGSHGDGTLAADGSATGNTDWPTSAGLGAGYHAGNWRAGGLQRCISNRYLATSMSDSDDPFGRGWRCVRSAP